MRSSFASTSRSKSDKNGLGPRRDRPERGPPDQTAVGGRLLRHPFLFLGFAQEGFGDFPRQPELAAQQAADEQSVIGVEPLGRVIDRLREFLSVAKAAFASSEPKPRDKINAWL